MIDKKQLEILVVEDNLLHQKAARRLLEEHNLRIAENFDEAVDLISNNKYDALLTDLFYKQGQGMQLANRNQAYTEMPFGFPLAIYGAKEGIPYVGIVTDMDHHQNPMAYTFDLLKNPAHGSDPAIININNSKVMAFDIRDLPGAYLDSESRIVYKFEDTVKKVKNWKAALDAIRTGEIRWPEVKGESSGDTPFD